MGFKSVLKKIGKVAKVVAPFALDFLPGGQLAHLAIAGGLGAATSHGGLKSRLLGAAEGAGSEYVGHLAGGGKLNPIASGKREGGKSIFSVGAGAVKNAVTKKTTNADGSQGDSVVSSLLKNPATYMAALSAFKDPNTDNRRAYSGIDATDSLNRAFSSARGTQDAIAARMRDPNAYNTASRIPSNRLAAPVNIGPLQIGGGLATTPEEEELRRQQQAQQVGR